MNFLEKFEYIIKNHNLFAKGDKILIAVSGGLDSVTLLDLFNRIQDDYNLTLRIIHLNHGIRGEEADRDQAFVQQLANQYKLPISVKKVNIPQYIEKRKCSLEEGARTLRYQFFKQELNKLKFNYLALGHNANDQVETILDHFLRGSGIRGLAGMKFSRDQFIRPLLAFTRIEIETYANQMRLNNVTDSTNLEIKYKRNKIRHHLIPYLEQEFNSAITNVILKTGRIFRENDIFLKEQAEKAFHSCLKEFKKNKIILDIDQFFNYFNVIKVYVLYHILNLLSIEENALSFTKIDAFLSFIQHKKTGTRFLIFNEWEILIDHHELVFYQPEEINFEFEVFLKRNYTIFNQEKFFIAELIKREQLPKSFPKERNVEYIDFEKVSEPLIIRNFQAGDRFIPLNMKGHKKVSDFFTDKKIPLNIRKEIPILTCPEGIIWIVGYQIDDRFKITEKSKTILKMEIKET